MLQNIQNVYFLGIGGIGMSALARWFMVNGYRVAGYDRTPTALTGQLQREGMAVHFDDAIENIPAEVLEEKEHTLVIYTPAIPKDHKEWNHLRELGYKIHKRAEVLGLITQQYFTVAVAGTHGKTTTSSMIAHILKACDVPCSAFLGGVTTNYNTNLILNKPNENGIVVVEADEFDRSFLWLKPNISVVTATDADHLDIYGKHDVLIDSFREFVRKTSKDGTVYLSNKAAGSVESAASEIGKTFVYGLTEVAIRAENVRAEDNAFMFDYVAENTEIKNIKLQQPGFHNVENALAAMSIALAVGLSPEAVKLAIEDFKGVKRRFEYIIKSDKVTFIDDYAHHPEEIRAFLSSVRALYPKKKITAIFQPHLYSRTRDFAEGFGESLSLADEVILTDIYPARELPMEGVSSQLIFDYISVDDKQLIVLDELLDVIRRGDFEVVVTVGAGDIDKKVEPLKAILLDKYETVQ